MVPAQYPHPKTNWVKFKHYKTKACLTCQIKEQCTSSTRGRAIQRSVHQGGIDRNNTRVNANPDYYREWQQIIEPVCRTGRHQFGTIKRQWCFTYALVRRKEKVLGEVSLLFTTYNLRRSVSILGFRSILKRLKARIWRIFRQFAKVSAQGAREIVNLISVLRRTMKTEVIGLK